MANHRQQSMTPKVLLAIATVTQMAIFASAQARAEIVIDDFVDAIQIVLPQDEDEWFYADSVGDVNAFRSVRVPASRTEPNGFLDVNLTEGSTLTAMIPDTRHTEIEPALGINLIYDFVSPLNVVDLTQGGRNDAVILDFARLTAATSLSRLLVSATDATSFSRYTSVLRPIPQSDEAFKLVLPFDTFQVDRGVPTDKFDFSTVIQVSVLIEIGLIDPTLPEFLDFSMQLREIRIGVVPEPATIISFVWSGLFFGAYRAPRNQPLVRAKKGVRVCGESSFQSWSHWQIG